MDDFVRISYVKAPYKHRLTKRNAPPRFRKNGEKRGGPEKGGKNEAIFRVRIQNLDLQGVASSQIQTRVNLCLQKRFVNIESFFQPIVTSHKV